MRVMAREERMNQSEKSRSEEDGRALENRLLTTWMRSGSAIPVVRPRSSMRVQRKLPINVACSTWSKGRQKERLETGEMKFCS